MTTTRRITATPNGCQHCGIPQREHMQQWKPEPIGWHTWVAPTQAQIKERMLARRAARAQAAIRGVENALWRRLQDEVTAIGRGYRGSTFETAEYTHADGISQATSTYSQWEQDGTNLVHAMTATWQAGEITVDVQRHVDSHDGVWGPDGSCQDDGTWQLVVIDHRLYEIRPERGQPEWRGFGGHRFTVEFFADGRRVTTTNLWDCGVVPPKWRDRWPNTARIIPTN